MKRKVGHDEDTGFRHEEGIEAPPKSSSVLDDFWPAIDRQRVLGYTTSLSPKTLAEKRKAARASERARRDPAFDRFYCRMCGGLVQRPPQMDLYDWERLRCCERCKRDDVHLPKGKCYCRKCSHLFKQKGCEVICPHCRKK